MTWSANSTAPGGGGEGAVPGGAWRVREIPFQLAAALMITLRGVRREVVRSEKVEPGPFPEDAVS